MKNLPHKTIERLSQYRRALLLVHASGQTHIFSHDIAKIIHITPVQVRRDIMLIGYTGTLRKGYSIQELIDLIGDIIDSEKGLKVCVVGVGNLGRAMIKYFSGKRIKLSIAACFDNSEEKIGKEFYGVICYAIDDLKKVIKKEGIKIAIMTVPAEYASVIADNLSKAGIKGILNYAPKPVTVGKGVYLEEYDMITSLEKVAFFVKTHA